MSRFETNVFEFFRHTDGKWYKRWTKHTMSADTLDQAKVQSEQYMSATGYPFERFYVDAFARYVMQSETVNSASNLFFWIMDLRECPK